MKTKTAASRRRGFTLIETIVTVGLIAVLAAFVVPSVIQKSGAADPVKVVNDLGSVRSGLEGFVNDTKVYPNSIWQLATKPTTLNHQIDSVSATSTGTGLTTGQINAWSGPYLSISIDSLPTAQLSTGFGAFIQNQLQRYDVQSNKGELFGGSTGATFNINNTLTVAIRINGLTLKQADVINSVIDGATDADLASGVDAGANVTGRFRFDKPNASNIVVAYYLAVAAAK